MDHGVHIQGVRLIGWRHPEDPANDISGLRLVAVWLCYEDTVEASLLAAGADLLKLALITRLNDDWSKRIFHLASQRVPFFTVVFAAILDDFYRDQGRWLDK